ncbi:MAG: bifunctional UDP-N-acetylglucosamine diphosphorylase/glucosamine-1-phosphate N-acetyltransferase GlmU [Paracoccaceae bacterium]
MSDAPTDRADTPALARPLAVVVLAAGRGKRMRSRLPKVLHPVGGRPMLAHVLATARALAPERVAVVVGHEGARVAEAARAADPDVLIAEQAVQRGTGDAVACAREALAGFEGDVLVLYADVPLLSVATLARLVGLPGAMVRVLGFEAAEPGGYGRLVLAPDGRLERIVEARDASVAEAAITACNSGVMAADAALLWRLLARVTNANAQGEYYLTDVPGLARAEGVAAGVAFCDEAEVQGVNDRVDLARAEAAFQTRARRAAMLAGATLADPSSVHLSWDTTLGRDVSVGPSVVFGPGVAVEDGARIEAFCHLADVCIGAGARVGPFARLRGGTAVGPDCRIGNFVEMKNADLGAGVKAGHLAYVGDASVGAGANLGAGTVTCNYDGVSKHRTTIGAGAFVGTNSSLVAPVAIGEGAYVATATTVTRDVEPGALAIARVEQTNRPGAVARLMGRLRARLAKD